MSVDIGEESEPTVLWSQIVMLMAIDTSQSSHFVFLSILTHYGLLYQWIIQ